MHLLTRSQGTQHRVAQIQSHRFSSLTLIEKLDQPYKAITAHVLVLDDDEINLDQALANRLYKTMTPRDLLVLPVMGIPGWDRASEDADFYSDSSVFRPSRRINDSRADTRRRA